MGRLLTIAATDLRRRIRNRSALIVAIVGPLAMAVVFGTLIGGASSVSIELGVVDDDRSTLSRQIVDGLVSDSGSSSVEFVALDSAAQARRRVDDAKLGAAFVIPAGFERTVSSVAAVEPITLEVWRDPRRIIAGQIAQSVAGSIAGGVDNARLAVATVAARDASLVSPALIAAAADAPDALTITDESAGDREASAGAFYGAAMSILFLFFTVGYAARSLLVERSEHTLQRLLATGASARDIIGAKTLSVAVLGFGGFVVVWAATSVGFGADWGNAFGVVAVIAATVVAVTGVASFVAALARTERQADSYTSAVTFVLALVGGNFLGPGAGPPLLRRLSMFTPNGWSLRAFTSLSADPIGIGSVGLELAVLVGFGIAFGAVAMLAMRKAVPS